MSPLLVTNKFSLYFTLSILEILFCGGLIAVVPLVCATKMNSAYRQGNAALYERNRSLTFKWLVAAGCIGLVANIAYAFLLFGFLV
ncbi:MAG: hypothetical protein LBL23_08760 [Coriobacteriales bacterium]|nr:hypothetical protein [Coriobacteriales bacterium]